MAEIKLYGNTINGDGKYIVSPFDIAAPMANGIDSYVADDKDPSKNIVSYINSKVSGLSTINGKVGIKSVSATVADITTSTFKTGATISPSITVTGNDGVSKTGALGISIPSIDNILANASTSYANTKNTLGSLVTSYSTLNSTVSTINAASGSGSFRQGDADTLASAKQYADTKVSNLGSVYHIEGTKSLTEIKALTNVKQGSVYNVSESFKIDSKLYPEYTNIVFLSDAASVTYDTTKGFAGTVVDALGGVQDLSNYSQKEDTIKSISWQAEATGSPLSSANAGSRGTIIVTRNNAVGTQQKINVSFKDAPNALKRSVTADSTGVQLYGNTLSLVGFEDAAGTKLSKGVILGTIAPSIAVTQATTGIQVAIKGDGDVFNRTGILSGTAGIIPAANKSTFGVVKIGDGINNVSGTISVPKNTFNTSKYLSVTSTTNTDKGQDFNLDIVCNTGSPASSIIPLQKADSTTLGIKINTSNTYIKLKQSNLDLGIDESILSTKIKGIESRITALETLLSLA